MINTWLDIEALKLQIKNLEKLLDFENPKDNDAIAIYNLCNYILDHYNLGNDKITFKLKKKSKRNVVAQSAK